jgi:hypothetical protein
MVPATGKSDFAGGCPSGWPAVDRETIYCYCFVAWPDESSPRVQNNGAIFELFRLAVTRCEVEMTESQFGDFRDELVKVGITLRSIERKPCLEPQTVV